LRRLRIYECRAARPSQALATGEYVLDTALKHRSPAATMCSWPSRSLVYGLYVATRGEESVERRITGGPVEHVERGCSYLALALPGHRKLVEAVELAKKLETCLGGRAHATLVEDVAYLELFRGETLEARELASCLEMGYELHGAPEAWRLEEMARMFESSRWRIYRWREATATARVVRGSFYLNLSVEVVDGYIVSWSLDSNMYAAPPMEPFNVLASVQGMRFDEIALTNLELAIRSRLEAYGITVDDIVEAVRRLYEAVQS
jgi:hypothetical protein